MLLSIKNRQTVTKNCRPISLLSISGKVLERLLYNSMFEFFIQNKLITPNQSRFKTGDSYINQIIFITHKIYKLFDDGCEVQGVFLDISKAFDKVWQQGLHYKLRQNCISGELSNTLTDFFIKKIREILIKIKGRNQERFSVLWCNEYDCSTSDSGFHFYLGKADTG